MIYGKIKINDCEKIVKRLYFILLAAASGVAGNAAYDAVKKAVGKIKDKKNNLRAIAINPRYADPHYNLGAIYHNKGLNQKAMEHFKQACELGSEDACQTLKGHLEAK